MEKIKLNLKDSIADTLLITLFAKSVESKKKDPLIIDDSACELVEKIDYDFSKYKNKPASSVGVAIRATNFDNIAKRFIEKNENPIVVLVGCGLDSRRQRIGRVGDKAIFYELDIEEVINVRKQLMPPADNEYFITSSMLETQWMDDLKAKHPDANFIFIIEGVLMYFNEADNKRFFTEIANRFPGAELDFDMLNKWMSTKSSIHDTVSKTNATFKFGTDDDKDLEKWHPKLKFERAYLFNEFKGWKRMGFVALLMWAIPKLKKSSRVLTYKVIN